MVKRSIDGKVMPQLLLTLVIVVASLVSAFGQKPALTLKDLSRWPTMYGGRLNNDGKYVATFSDDFLTISATALNWSDQIPNAKLVTFSKDGKRAIISMGDTLISEELGTAKRENIAIATNHQVENDDGDSAFLTFQKKDDSTLVVYDLFKRTKKSFLSVYDYKLSGDQLVFQYFDVSKRAYELKLYDCSHEKLSTIFSGQKAVDISFDRTGGKFVFLTTEDQVSSIYAYDEKGQKLTKVFSGSETTKTDFSLSGIKGFNYEGDKIFINLKLKATSTTQGNGVKVDVWNYKDAKLQSQQLAEIGNHEESRIFLAAVNINNGKVVQVEESNQRCYQGCDVHQPGDIAIVSEIKGNIHERSWNPLATFRCYLVDLQTGLKTSLDSLLKCNAISIQLSPKGDFIVFFNREKRNYYSFERRTNKIINLTATVNTLWTYESDYPIANNNFPIAGWLKNDKAFLVYDRTDIWQIDPSGAKAPSCLTNGYGAKHHLTFRLATPNNSGGIDPNDALNLSVLDNQLKSEGYCSVKLNKANSIEGLTMQDVHNEGFTKARDANVFLITKSSAERAPNLFVTTDFREFKQISEVYPEDRFNWLSSKLFIWTKPDRTKAQGILYLPEDFSPQKKYPVIVHLYEKLSDNLNNYLWPHTCSGDINIAYFVSNGYIVFSPDITYKVGHTGQSICDAVLSGITAIKKFSWINAKAIGVQGISFGGYETNFLITHSKDFAAAVSASGPSDFVSGYNSLFVSGESGQYLYETFQNRIGGTLWQRPDLYVKNSPIFYADKVTTPVLLMNNKKDEQVRYTQGIEFFTALRRLKKKAWMLQYDEGEHGLPKNTPESIDFTIRVKQFFDHYLKDAPPPRWMVDGIPASMKGIDPGYELIPNTQP
ncbi:MAG: prolyl oligopeptidase family serine peptidase [Bacteroidota bacterium]